MADTVELVQAHSNQGHILKLAKKLSIAEERRRSTISAPKVHRILQRLSPEILAQIAAEYLNGATTTLLRDQYDLGQGTVLQILRDAGVEMRRKGLSDL